MRRWLIAVLLGLAVQAQAAPEYTEDEEPTLVEEVDDGDGMVVRGQRLSNPLTRDRAVSRITRKQMATQGVRSTPDAIKAAPGAYVQKTGHSQASVYLRGRTGQQVLLLFDGLRINNALFRQGPNQYLFTVDSRTLETIDVVRGSASVSLGADAMAGAIMLRPRAPTIDPSRDGVIARPAILGRYATADSDLGGRAELDLQLNASTGVLLGVGLRDVGQLESSGSVGHLLREEETMVPLFEKEVPSFEADGRTQRGTGFGEFTGDLRVLHQLDEDDELAFATYIYRQTDAPRTDQCPPPEASITECLVYKQQNRTHSYVRADLSPGWLALDRLEGMLGWQRQFEERERDSSETLGAITGGEDQLDIWGARVVGHSRPFKAGPLRLDVDYGLDGSWETVSSSAYIELVRAEIRRESPRGQYLDGSRYQQGGLWASSRAVVYDDLTMRAGARFAYSAADAPGNVEAESATVDRSWLSAVANAGVAWRPTAGLSLQLNYEQGFRPPNLDDLTGRQATGRGYQLENSDLRPERAQTAELGLGWDRAGVELALWASLSWIEGTMERRSAACPASNRACRASRAAVELVNLSGLSEVRSVEAMARAALGYGLWARATFAWTKGEGDNPNEGIGGRVPLSRIPPINGVGELGWRHRETGVYLEAATRWALDQTELSVGDLADARIPFGGTPGYVTFEARVGLIQPKYAAYLVFENLTDVPNRTHGSAINGPGRGLILNVEVKP